MREKWTPAEDAILRDGWRGSAQAGHVARRLREAGHPERTAMAMQHRLYKLGLKGSPGRVGIPFSEWAKGFNLSKGRREALRREGKRLGLLVNEGGKCYLDPHPEREAKLRAYALAQDADGVTVKVAARQLGVDPNRVWDAIARGALRSIRIPPREVLVDPVHLAEVVALKAKITNGLAAGTIFRLEGATKLLGMSMNGLLRHVSRGNLAASRPWWPGVASVTPYAFRRDDLLALAQRLKERRLAAKKRKADRAKKKLAAQRRKLAKASRAEAKATAKKQARAEAKAAREAARACEVAA